MSDNTTARAGLWCVDYAHLTAHLFERYSALYMYINPEGGTPIWLAFGAAHAAVCQLCGVASHFERKFEV